MLPQARRGIFTSLTISWARALGEFGPILVFAGATRMLEVLAVTVFLELSIGNLESAVAVSLLMMVAAAVIVLVLVREFGIEAGK